jgi:hypothetical protein
MKQLTKKRPRKAHLDARDFRFIVQAIPLGIYADPILLSTEITDWLLVFFKQFLMRDAQRLLKAGLPVADYAYLAALSPGEFGDYIMRVANGELEAHPELLREFSEFVFAQAETTIGWRLDLCPHVSALKRIWERQKPEMLAKYGRACECGARVARREQFARLDVRAEHAVREEAVSEMDSIREKLRLAFPDAQTTTADELLQKIAEITSTSDAYPALRRFSEEYGSPYTRENVRSLLMRMPPSSSDLWGAWRSQHTGHSEERLRKIISSGNFPQANPQQ